MISSVSWSFSIQGSPVLLAGFALLSLIMVVWLYRKTYPPLSRGLRIFLGIVRGVALLLIILLLFHPVLHIIRHFVEKPDIAVLIDTSRSMSIKDGNQRRSDIAKSVLKNKVFGEIDPVCNLHYFSFSVHAKPIQKLNIDSLSFTGDGTDISQALQDVRKNLLNHYFSAVILISDGIYNTGENPVYLAQNYDVPVYTVGIGDPTEKKDVLIARVLTNEVVYAKNRVPVDVVVTHFGFEGQKVMVFLKQAGKVLDSKPLTLGPSNQEEVVHLFFTPLREGFQKYEVSISGLKSEFTRINNRRSFYVKVLKSKLKVLILAGGPSPDVKFVRRILDDDKNMDVTILAQKRGGGYYVIPRARKWFSVNFDAFVLIDFPRWTVRSDLRKFLDEKLVGPRHSLLFIEGENLQNSDLRFLQPVLPFKVDQAPRQLREVYLQLTPAGEVEDILRVGDNLETTLGLWQDLPPVDTYLQNYSPLPGTKILAVVDPAKSKLPPSVQFKKPLILVRNVGKEKSVALMFENVWRWDLMMWGIGKNDEVLQKFLTRTVRWLATRMETKPVQLKTDRQIYRSGEEAVFLGQVYDKAFKPVDGADFKVRVKSGKDTLTLLLDNIGNGKYEGRFRIPAAGTYTYKGTAFLNDMKLGTASGKFSAGEFQIEFLQTRMNEKLLQQISARTSGTFYLPRNVSRLKKDLKFSSRELSSENTYTLWNVWLLLAVIIFLFVIEWSIRRRKGLL
ncbi:MAG: VWA domain-containing protein [Calditrichaeota bacterium]|nr:VWA domain-containing protein [Calditrichota bacterium]